MADENPPVSYAATGDPDPEYPWHKYTPEELEKLKDDVEKAYSKPMPTTDANAGDFGINENLSAYLQLHQIKDTKNNSLVEGERYYIIPTDESPSKSNYLKSVEGNRKKIKFDIHAGKTYRCFLFQIQQIFKVTTQIFSLRHLSGKYLVGIHGPDITFGSTLDWDSPFAFKDAGPDKMGQPSYQVFARTRSAGDTGGDWPIWLSDSSVDKIYYDDDQEWRSFTLHDRPSLRYIHIKFVRFTGTQAELLALIAADALLA